MHLRGQGSIVPCTMPPSVAVFAVASNNSYALTAIAALRAVRSANGDGVACYLVGQLHPLWVEAVTAAGLQHVPFAPAGFRRVDRYPAEVFWHPTLPSEFLRRGHAFSLQIDADAVAIRPLDLPELTRALGGADLAVVPETSRGAGHPHGGAPDYPYFNSGGETRERQARAP